MKYPYYKCELHLHLDGSLSAADGWELAKTYHIDPGFPNYETYAAHTHVDHDCHDLYQYLQCFDIPLRILQYEQPLEECAYRLGRSLAAENVLYAEVRFAPQQHTKQGLKQEEVVTAVLRGLQRAMEEAPIVLQGLLCMMILSEDTHDANVETLRLTQKYLHKGIGGLDLAGAEGIRALSEFKELFTKAKHQEIPFTMHAGENGYPQHIQTALKWGAKRIGHGVHAIRDEAIISTLIQNQIPLEVCYTSNLQCHVFPEGMIHPIRQLWEKGVLITINTDNRSISNTSLEQEYDRLRKDFSFTDEDFRHSNEIALQHALLDSQTKSILLQKLKEPIPAHSKKNGIMK